MRRILPVFFSVLLVWSSQAFAQIPQSLVKDLSPGKLIGNGSTSNFGINSGASAFATKIFLTHNSFTYFAAGDDSGYYLWKTDGTSEGTSKIWFLGSSENHLSIRLCLVGNTIFFTYSNAKYGEELWKTDGTTEGTSLVKDITVGVLGSYPHNMINVNGTLYFITVTGSWPSVVYSLWKTDGTNSGTILLKNTFTNDGIVGSPTAMNGILYFFANRNITSNPKTVELWKSDGSPEGTVAVGQWSISSGFLPTDFTVFNGSMYFVICSPTGCKLCKSDGTSAGTYVSDRTGREPQLTINGDKLYFTAFDNNDILQLWETAGDLATTQKVTNESESISKILKPVSTEKIIFFVGSELKQLETVTGSISLIKTEFSSSYNSTSFNSKVFFAANSFSTNAGMELWTSDGTQAGTFQIKNIAASPNQSSLYYDQSTGLWEIERLGNHIIFFANDGFNGRELWKSDGTEAGTVMVKDIHEGNFHSSPTNFVDVNNDFFFRTTQTEASGFSYGLWKSDGKSDGTVQLKNFGVEAVSNLTDVNGTLFFAGATSSNGDELWKSDGTPEGTVLVQDIWAGSNSSYPRNLTNLDGTLLFSASTASGTELWKSDGITTQLVKDINPASGSSSSQPEFFTRVGNLIYFYATTSAGRELWKTDGSEGGTMIVKDIFAGSSSGIGYSVLTNRPFPINGIVYFKANNGATGDELWKSDGTADGTVLVKDIRAGSTGSAPEPAANVNGNLYFFANDGVSDGLWKTDGSADGTLKIKTLPVGRAAISGSIGGLLAFVYNDNANGKALWRSDGTEAGTYVIKDFYEGQGLSTQGLKFLTLGNELYFTVYTANEGDELWKTDGTAAGTQLQQDIDGTVGNINKGTYGYPFSEILAHEGSIFYSSFHPSTGEELFTFVPPLSLAENGSIAENLIVDGTKLYLMASGYKVIGSVNGKNVYDAVNTFKAKVTINDAVSAYSGQPYLQRHFDLEPGVADPSTSTATVTLYVSQAEFTAFNSASTVKLPANAADTENYKTNLRIWQWHGTPTTTPSAPGSYTGAAATTINPADTDITWNTSLSAWEITFNVTGFSGFFITAEGAEPLPVTLISFLAQKQENTVALNWETAEETNSGSFEIQHSVNGKHWSKIGQVNASGESRTLQRYTHTHLDPASGENLYRMKMVDQDGTFAMSKIVSVKMNGLANLTIFPNPATNAVSATSREAIIEYQLLAADGKIMRQNAQVHTRQLDVKNLNIPAGLYLLKLTLENGTIEHRKLVIK